jgi:hypothetical protein
VALRRTLHQMSMPSLGAYLPTLSYSVTVFLEQVDDALYPLPCASQYLPYYVSTYHVLPYPFFYYSLPLT